MQESKESLERLRRMGQFEAQDFDVVVSSETVHILMYSLWLASAHQILQILTISEDAFCPFLACEPNTTKRETLVLQQCSAHSGVMIRLVCRIMMLSVRPL